MKWLELADSYGTSVWWGELSAVEQLALDSEIGTADDGYLTKLS